MNSNPVAQIAAKFGLEDLKTWLTAMVGRGVYGANPARLRATAVDALASILAPDEPREVGYMLEKIDELTDRWTTKNNAKPETAATYRSRAKGALEDFLRYKSDPTAFKPKKAATAGEPKKAEKKIAEPEKKQMDIPATVETATSGAVPPATSRSLRTYPLAAGGDFEYRLPEGGLKARDVMRIACHLLTMSVDFDPADAAHRAMFTLAKTGE